MATFHTVTPKKCPPKDAVSSNGKYCRIVFNNPPTSEDFVIWILEPENNHELAKRTQKGDCSSFGISMLTEEGILRKSGLFWRGIKKRAERRKAQFLGWAEVQLDSDSGVLKQTGRDPDHYDLWPYVTCKLESQVVSVKGI